MKDLKFIAGHFSEFQIPKEKAYLLRYFTSDVQIAFLKYFMIFGNHKQFQSHTGFACDESLCRKLEKRYLGLVKLYDEAKKSFTEEGLETLHLIESGKFNLTRLGKS